MCAGRLPRFCYVLFGSAMTLAAVTFTAVPAAQAAVRAPAAAGIPARPQPYGPSVPVSGAPGGFAAVVTSRTITPAGGTITATVDGALVTLTIPPGAFPVPVQITITAPALAAIGSAGFAGFLAVSGVGIQVEENGSPYPGTFLKPITLTIRSSAITSSSAMVVWNGTAFVSDPGATVSAGTAMTSFDRDPNFAVLSPSGTTGGPIAGATTPMTGEPFLGEGIAAAMLLLLGTAGLILVIRRRRARA